MHAFQIWLVTSIRLHSPVAKMMHTAWGWPMAESLHFLGLCLLIGSIGAFDLRLLGVGRRVPLSAVHRFIPFGLMGFAINMTTGLLFLLTGASDYWVKGAMDLSQLDEHLLRYLGPGNGNGHVKAHAHHPHVTPHS